MTRNPFSRSMNLFIWIFYCWNIAAAQTSTGGANLVIEWTYSNPESKLDNGNTCDRHVNSQCDVYFDLCLRNAASQSTQRCHLLQRVTWSYHNMDHVTIRGKDAPTLTIPQPVPNTYTFEMGIQDEDYFPSSELIGRFIAENFELKPNRTWKDIPMINVSPQKRNPKLVLKVLMKLECVEHYYGDHCMKECRPDLEKYDCDENGNKVCFPGLTGPDCDHEDSCYYEACAPHATCVNREDSKGRVCICNGREGPECYPDHDPCSTSPCQNGGLCHAFGTYNESFRCNCTEPWTGHRCSERRLACLEAAMQRSEELQTNSTEVCLNGGKCLEYTDRLAYQCHCAEGWTGEHCELAANVNKNALIVGGISIIAMLLIILTVAIVVTLVWRHRSIMRKFKDFDGRDGIVYYHNNRDSTSTECSTVPVLRNQGNEIYGSWMRKDPVLVFPPNSNHDQKGITNGVYDECDPFGVYSKPGPLEGDENLYPKRSSVFQQGPTDDSAPPLPERPQNLGLSSFKQTFSDSPATEYSFAPYKGTNTFDAYRTTDTRPGNIYRPLSPNVYRAPSTFSNNKNS